MMSGARDAQGPWAQSGSCALVPAWAGDHRRVSSRLVVSVPLIYTERRAVLTEAQQAGIRKGQAEGQAPQDQNGQGGPSGNPFGAGAGVR